MKWLSNVKRQGLKPSSQNIFIQDKSLCAFYKEYDYIAKYVDRLILMHSDSMEIVLCLCGSQATHKTKTENNTNYNLLYKMFIKAVLNYNFLFYQQVYQIRDFELIFYRSFICSIIDILRVLISPVLTNQTERLVYNETTLDIYFVSYQYKFCCLHVTKSTSYLEGSWKKSPHLSY